MQSVGSGDSKRFDQGVAPCLGLLAVRRLSAIVSTGISRASPIACVSGAFIIATSLIPLRAADIVSMSEAQARCSTAKVVLGYADLPDESDTCRVVAFRRVSGVSPAVFYQLQAFLQAGQTPETQQLDTGLEVGGPDNDGAGVALFVSDRAGKLTLIGSWSGQEVVVEEPVAARTSQGPILVVPNSQMVSSHPMNDLAFRAVKGKWTLMTDEWSRQIHIPHGVEQWHGNMMDWQALKAYGAFWKPKDAECCPTGGSYTAELRLQGSGIELKSVRYARHGLPDFGMPKVGQPIPAATH